MKVFIQRTINEDWAVWVGGDYDETAPEDATIFNPGDKGGYWRDAWAYAKFKSEDLGFDLREVAQPR
jgi:hypothetical protein